jgi:hypothetical protein
VRTLANRPRGRFAWTNHINFQVTQPGSSMFCFGGCFARNRAKTIIPFPASTDWLKTGRSQNKSPKFAKGNRGRENVFDDFIINSILRFLGIIRKKATYLAKGNFAAALPFFRSCKMHLAL